MFNKSNNSVESPCASAPSEVRWKCSSLLSVSTNSAPPLLSTLSRQMQPPLYSI